ncbi:hypothetical protein [uncultured Shewanella sp.]|uniref:hypothetical protein n=1 Tax=uncultured Shewanella sp. TaxID=173975 RepID=UPI00260C2F10|nr:hypothetical protein [uncultured Shewanella sp.]
MSIHANKNNNNSINSRFGPLMEKIMAALDDGKTKSIRDLLVATNASSRPALRESLQRLIDQGFVHHEKVTILAGNDAPMPRNAYRKAKRRNRATR